MIMMMQYFYTKTVEKRKKKTRKRKGRSRRKDWKRKNYLLYQSILVRINSPINHQLPLGRINSRITWSSEKLTPLSIGSRKDRLPDHLVLGKISTLQPPLVAPLPVQVAQDNYPSPTRTRNYYPTRPVPAGKPVPVTVKPSRA